MKLTYFLFVSLIPHFISSFYIKNNNPNIELNNFTFGSCFYGRESTRLDMFEKILDYDPQLFIWMGDAAYVDPHTLLYYWKSSLDVNFTQVNEIFNQAKNEKYYSKLREKIPTIGVWDDHDFGLNDGNGHFKHKEEVKQVYLDFLDEPADSIRRENNRPIYTCYSFGDPDSHKTARFILLDVRYNKTSLLYDKEADMLGEDQWQWLENELITNKETFTFIVSGTQILPFNRFVTEAWYGSSRQRLFDLLARTKKSGVVLLTGDIHAAQILKTFCVLPEVGYNLYEITSSGLSHYDEDNYLMEFLLPTDYNVVPTISDYNFGKINFNWGRDKEESSLTVSIIDIDKVVRAGINLSYSDLVYNKNRTSDKECYSKLNRRFKTIKEIFNIYKKTKFGFLFLTLPYLWIVHLLYLLIKLFVFVFRFFMRKYTEKLKAE